MHVICDKLLVSGLAALCLLVVEASRPAAAQTYLDDYKVYNAALENGDVEAAARHGYAAWQAAEAELGDDGLTAILAYNYGQLVLFSDAGNAAKALRRAETLRADGVADLPESELRLYLAFAEFALDDGASRKRKALREALFAIEAEGYPPNADISAMWLRLAKGDLEDERYRDAVESGAMAEAAIMAAIPDNKRVRIEALMIQAVATVIPYPRTVDDTLKAHQFFKRARMLFEPQKDIETFDPLLAQVVAWDQATRAAMLSLGAEEYPDHSEHDEKYGIKEKSLLQKEPTPLEECNVVWKRRKVPEYPSGPLVRGTFGAVVVGYRLSNDTEPKDVRVLAGVPSNVFGNDVLRSIRRWELEAPPKNDPGCLSERLVYFTFVITQ